MVMWNLKSSSKSGGRVDDCSTSSSILVRHSPKKRSKGKVKRRHSVDFAGSADVVEFESADEGSKDQMWYTKEEFGLIKERNSLIVKMIKKGTFAESDEESVRGLEHKLRRGQREREDNKFDGLNAVLCEQDKQYVTGKKANTSKIAAKYEEAAARARDSAVSMALLDATGSYAFGEGKPLVVVADEDENSVISDIDSVIGDSDDWYDKKMKLQSVFQGLSMNKKDKLRRRASV